MASFIGLCVVYLVDEPYEFLFYKHLEQIRRCSENFNIRIYAAVNRLAPKYVEHLRVLDFVKLCELAPTVLRGSDEHAHYLDQLTALALSDGAAYIATLDVDSFPIDPNWLARSQAMLRDGAALVGVLRTENRDIATPHPSYMFFAREFHERFRPTFALPSSPLSEAFLRASGQRRLDTGAGYAMVLAAHQLPWARLLRSNKVNDHPLMGGVYGHMVYHFGGVSRDKVFVVDLAEARRLRPKARKRDVYPEIAARNERIAQDMLSQMTADFDAYLRRLLGA